MDYLYEAVDSSGKTIMGRIEAKDEGEVQRKLTYMGYSPQSIAPIQTAPVAANTRGQGSVAVAANPARTLPQTVAQNGSVARSSSITLAGNAAKLNARVVTQAPAAPRQNFLINPVNPNASKMGGVPTKDLMFFFQQLAPLVKSGMTIYAALDNLAHRTKNKNLAQTAHEMAEAARTGQRVSDVMELYPRIYPDHIMGMVRAGETGGFLEIALAEIALNFEQNLALYKWMWVPKLLATQSLYVLAVVIPLMPCLFASMDIAANMLLYVKWELLLLPIAFGVQMLIKFLVQQAQLPQYRRFRDGMSLKFPAFGNLQREAALSAFVRMLRRLYHAGVPPIQAWECAMNTVANVVLRERLGNSYLMMQQGASLSDAFSATGLFDNQIENLVITGQQSGEVVESLDKAADYYQEQLQVAAVRARRVMFSMGLTTMLVLGGAAVCWLTYSEYHSMFKWVDDNFKADYLPLY